MSVSQAVIKKTQDSLGKYVKKPPLTEKLLNKPPFRFLHDVISAVIRATGTLEGLYNEAESKSENVKGLWILLLLCMQHQLCILHLGAHDDDDKVHASILGAARGYIVVLIE